MDFFDRAVKSRCAGSQADSLYVGEPLRFQFVRTFHMQCGSQMFVTETNKLASVVRCSMFGYPPC